MVIVAGESGSAEMSDQAQASSSQPPPRPRQGSQQGEDAQQQQSPSEAAGAGDADGKDGGGAGGAGGGDAAETYEQTHVHSVYEAIAPHFSSTRHKPWPQVTRFLQAQPPGSVGLDVGCGNGKYLGAVDSSAALHMLASDRSAALARLARAAHHDRHRRGAGSCDLLVADSLALPFRPAAADFAICVAVLHHLSTRPRRTGALAALLACVRPAGRVLVYVWALEQKGSRRGWGEGDPQDTLVPWVLRSAAAAAEGGAAECGGERGGVDGETYQRYYHLYRKGELEEDVVATGGTVLEAGYERDNWWVICCRGDS